MTAFYKNYVFYCAKAGKSLSAVAEEVGLSRTSPNGWKKGKLPRDSTLIKLADCLQITVEDLLSENENKPAPIESELTKAQREAVELIKTMSDEQLKIFIATLKAYTTD